MTEPHDILIRNRKQLLFTLSEASETEHNVMCCYFCAAWSLKTEADDCVDESTRQELLHWQRSIVHSRRTVATWSDGRHR